MTSSYGRESALAGTVTGVFLMGLVVLLLFAGWCLIRATNLVLRVLVRHPGNRVLWPALAAFFASCALAGLFQTELAIAVAAMAGGILVLVARGVELFHSELFEAPPGLDSLAQDVLHEWWKEAF